MTNRNSWDNISIMSIFKIFLVPIIKNFMYLLQKHNWVINSSQKFLVVNIEVN